MGRASAVVFGGAVGLALVSDLERLDFFGQFQELWEVGRVHVLELSNGGDELVVLDVVVLVGVTVAGVH